MTEEEIIIVDQIPDADYYRITEHCVKYAMISLPFVYDRIHSENILRRIHHMASSRLGKSLFRYFCEQNGLYADFASCTTPFWQEDLRDFVYAGHEWEVMNNFITHPEELLHQFKYVQLPSLIPNHRPSDPWPKKNEPKIFETIGSIFLFTFMRNTVPENTAVGRSFLDIHMSKQQQEFMEALYAKFKGYPQTTQPYVKEWFRDELAKRGDMNFFTLKEKPHLIITAYAGSKQWRLFHQTGPQQTHLSYNDFISPHWYSRHENGPVIFLNNTLKTNITNATCPVAKLPSFLSLFPKLQEKVVCGKLKQDR